MRCLGRGRRGPTRAAGDPVFDFVELRQRLAGGGQTQKRVRRRQRRLGRRVSRRRRTTRSRTPSPPAMTNIGNCVPTSALFASSTSGIMTSLDEIFAGASRASEDARRDGSDQPRLRRAGQDRRDRVRAHLRALVRRLGQAAPHPGAARRERQVRQGRRRPSTSRTTRASTRRSCARSAIARARRDWRKMETRVIVARADDTDPDDRRGPAERAVRHVRLERGRDHRDARHPAVPRPDALEGHRPHLHHRRAPLPEHPRHHHRAPSTARWRSRSRATRTTRRTGICCSTTPSPASSAACSATWGARPRTSCSASSRCRSRGGRPAPAGPTTRPAPTS